MIIAGSSELQMQSVLYSSGGLYRQQAAQNPAASWAAHLSHQREPFVCHS